MWTTVTIDEVCQRDLWHDNLYYLRTQPKYFTAEWEPAFVFRQAREFLFFPLLPREASK